MHFVCSRPGWPRQGDPDRHATACQNCSAPHRDAQWACQNEVPASTDALAWSPQGPMGSIGARWVPRGPPPGPHGAPRLPKGTQGIPRRVLPLPKLFALLDGREPTSRWAVQQCSHSNATENYTQWLHKTTYHSNCIFEACHSKAGKPFF